MAMRLAPKPNEDFKDEAHTRGQVMDRLRHYSEMRRQHDSGTFTGPVKRSEMTVFIDGWLATLCELDELQCTGEGCSLCAKEKEAAHAE